VLALVEGAPMEGRSGILAGVRSRRSLGFFKWLGLLSGRLFEIIEEGMFVKTAVEYDNILVLPHLNLNGIPLDFHQQ
jgi:hypothetical protein